MAVAPAATWRLWRCGLGGRKDAASMSRGRHMRWRRRRCWRTYWHSRASGCSWGCRILRGCRPGAGRTSACAR
eukprot:104833-Chlamydomonas_euryale.AAC.2